jgi:hypothetical protein
MPAHKNGLLSKHRQAVLLAVFGDHFMVIFLVLIKVGLQDIPAQTFAGLRYTLAFSSYCHSTSRLKENAYRR